MQDELIDIEISEELAHRLESLREGAESVDDVVQRLLKIYGETNMNKDDYAAQCAEEYAEGLRSGTIQDPNFDEESEEE